VNALRGQIPGLFVCNAEVSEPDGVAVMASPWHQLTNLELGLHSVELNGHLLPDLARPDVARQPLALRLLARAALALARLRRTALATEDLDVSLQLVELG